MAALNSADVKVWAVVPAAGTGARMGSDRPKQYLSLGGEPILTRSIARLAADERVRGIVVVISAGDEHWPRLTLPSLRCALWVALGGLERCHSVRNGLHKLLEQGARPSDWVLVHDAARPCLPAADLKRLIDTVWNDEVGGLLAVPVADTLKLGDEAQRVAQTVSRQNMWRAQTPQMFRLGMLVDALSKALDSDTVVTDEAQAMELLGFNPRLVPGSEDNLKITHPADLQIAADVLRRQEGET